MTVLIDALNFPNEDFRNYVSTYLDLNGDGVLSDDEISRVTTLTVPYDGYSDISTGAVGIEYFTELTELTIPFTRAKDVNFGALQKLQKLCIRNGEHSTDSINLDFRNNANLRELEITTAGYYDGNWHDNLYTIKSLYLSPALQQLMIDYSDIRHNGSTGEIINPESYIDLDFTNCANIRSVSLQYFHCRSIIGLNNKTQLTDIEFAGLRYLAGTLDLSNDSRLEHLGIIGSEDLSGINIDGCNNITDVELLYTGIRGSLDFSSSNKLNKAYIVDNNIYSLVLGNQDALSNLYVLNNSSKVKIQSLDITGCPILMDLVTSTSPERYGNVIISDFTAFSNFEHYFYYLFNEYSTDSINYDRTNYIYSTIIDTLDTNLCYDVGIVLIDVDPPTIINSPIATKAATNGTATFHVAATSSKLNYLWQYSSDNGVSWTDDTNSNSADYSFTAIKLDSGNKYRCKVYNVAGEVYSSAATLTVIDPVVINTNLEKKIAVGVDQSATLSIAVSGEDIDYQWQVGKFVGNPDGSLWNDVPNTSGTLTGLNSNHVLQFSFTASESTDGRFYRCVLSNDVSNVVSEETQIDVIEKPVIDVQPKSANAATGKNATFSVSVSGVNLTYQWQEKPVDGSWTNIEEDADDRFYILKGTKADTGKKFRCIIRNEAGSVTSNSATLTVLDAPVITTDLIAPTVENGSTVELTVTATGDAIQYQWESSSDNRSTWVPITNDSDIPSTYSFTATENQNGNYYRCIVSNPVGSVSSSEQKLTVVTLPSIVAQPKSVSIGRGEVATFKVTVSGDVSGYQWQVYTSEASAWTNVPENGNTAVYSVTADIAMNGNRYRCLINNPLNSSKIKTKTVTLAVFNPIIIITPSSDYVVNADLDEQATFSVEATGDDLSYQWQYYDLSTEKWRSGSGATDTSYTTTATEARNGRQYRCKVFNDYLTVYSPVARLNVIIPPPPIITTEPASISVGVNKPATFSVEVSNPPVTYQWQVSTDNGSTWTNVSDGGTEASYRVDEASSEMGNYQYRCVLTNTRGETTSNAAVLSIIPVPVIVRQPVSVSATVGSTVTFSVQANGEQLKYQWQYSKNGGGTWKNAPSSNASAKTNTWTLTVSAAYDSYRFRCIVSNPSSTGVESEVVSITISAPPEITKNISSVTVNEGESVTFSINATGGDLNYQWQVSINNGRDWINVSNNGHTSAYSVTANANQNQNQFRCKVWNALGEVYSNNAIVSIRSKPQITSQPRSVTAVYGVSATFVVVAEGGELTYQWQQSLDDGETWKNIKGYTKPTFSVTATEARNGRQFRCVVTNDAGSTTSDAALFTTFESSGNEDDNSDDQEQYTDRYLPSEMAEAIRRIKSGFSGTNLDEIAFGMMTEDELYRLSTNPGATDPIYYEKIGEALNELLSGIDYRDHDIFIEKTITKNGEYMAFDDGAYGYSSVIVNSGVSEADNGKVVRNGILVDQTAITVTQNGTVDTTTKNSVTVAVGNTYSVSDKGKVVSSAGKLVEQTTQTITENGVYDTTTIKSVEVEVSNAYSSADDGKVIVNGELTEQTELTVTANGTYNTTTNDSVIVSVPNAPRLIPKEITANGTYNPQSDGAEGYTSVFVNVQPNIMSSKSITQNGVYLARTENVDGYGAVEINVDLNLQNKTIDTNGIYTADKNSGYNGLSQVNVNVQPKLQSKTVTENGTVVSDNGWDGLSEVTVNVQQVLNTLHANENNIYTPPNGINGFSKVYVNVPNHYTDNDNGRVVIDGALQVQTPLTVNQNGTYDTTTHNVVSVNVVDGSDVCDRLTTSDGKMIRVVPAMLTDENGWDIIATLLENSSIVSLEMPELLSSAGIPSSDTLTELSLPSIVHIGDLSDKPYLETLNAPLCQSIENCASTCLIHADFPACTEIGYAAFRWCDSLTSAHFPACTDIGERAFESCTELETAEFSASANFPERVFDSVLQPDTDKTFRLYLRGTTVGSCSEDIFGTLGLLERESVSGGDGDSSSSSGSGSSQEYDPDAPIAGLEIYVPAELIDEFKSSWANGIFANNIFPLPDDDNGETADSD